MHWLPTPLSNQPTHCLNLSPSKLLFVFLTGKSPSRKALKQTAVSTTIAFEIYKLNLRFLCSFSQAPEGPFLPSLSFFVIKTAKKGKSFKKNDSKGIFLKHTLFSRKNKVEEYSGIKSLSKWNKKNTYETTSLKAYIKHSEPRGQDQDPMGTSVEGPDSIDCSCSGTETL